MAADGTPSMADVLDSMRAAHALKRDAHASLLARACFSPQYMGGRVDTNEENAMSEPLDPQDAQNPDDTSGGADTDAGLQGDVAADSDEN